MADFMAKLGLTLDSKNVDSEINRIKSQIEKTPIKIPVQVDNTALDNFIKKFQSGFSGAKTNADGLVSSVQKINTALNTGAIDAAMSKTTTQFNSLKNTSVELQANFSKLQQAQQALTNSGNEKQLVSNYEKWNAQLQTVNNQMKVLQQSQAQYTNSTNLDTGILNFQNKISAYLSKNTNLGRELKDQFTAISQEASKVGNTNGLKNLEKQFQSLKYTASAMGQTGRSFFDNLKNSFGQFGQFLTVGTATMKVIQGIRSGISTIVEMDTALTEISKTSGIAREELEALGNASFDTASKFATKATDYLNAVKEMNRAGFQGDSGNNMAQLALQLQTAGDMTNELANDMLLSTNAAYQYNGAVDQLKSAFDGMDYITNNNALSMTDMGEAMKVVGSQAANTGVQVNELAALIGTGVATTKKSGSEVGTALKSLFINLQNVGSDKINKTLEQAGTSMTTLKDGVEQMRTPVEILKDLAKTYNSLDAKDPLKSIITTNLGGKHYAGQLSSILTNFDQYEKMLNQFSDSQGTLDSEMAKTVDSIQGRMATFSNSWNKMISSFVNTDLIKTIVSLGTTFVNVFNGMTETLGGFGTALTIFGGVNILRNLDGIKNWLTGLGQVQAAINSMQGMTVGIDAGTMALTQASLTSYSASIEGLNLQQAQLALSTTQLSAAQQQQVLVEAGLVASSDALTATMAQQALAAVGVGEAEQIAILGKAGLIDANGTLAASTITCTTAELEQAAADAGVSVSNLGAASSAITMAGANATATVSFKTLAASAIASAKAMFVAMAANPLTWVVAAGAAIFGLVKVFDYVNSSAERSKEALADTMKEFDDSSTKVSEATTALKENENAIEQLQSKGKLTYVEQAELDKLKAATTELKEQKIAAEELQKSKANEAGKQNSKTFNQDFGKVDGVNVSDNYVSYATSKETDAKTVIPQIIALQKKYKQELEAGNTDVAGVIKKGIDNLTSNVSNGNYAEVLTQLTDYKKNLLDIMSFRELTDSENDTMSQINDWQKQIYTSIGQTAQWNESQMDQIFAGKGIEKTREELVSMAKENYGVSESTISSYSNLAEAINKSGIVAEDGKTSMQSFLDEINAEAGVVDTATSSYDRLSQAYDKFATGKSKQDSKINSYLQTLSNGDIAELLSADINTDGIKKATDMIGVLQQTLDQAKIDDFKDTMNELSENNFGFENDDALDKYRELAETTGLDAESFNELTSECHALGYAFSDLGVSQELAITMMNQFLTTGNMDGLTTQVVSLNKEVKALSDSFALASGARSNYESEMGAQDFGDNFKSYEDAYKNMTDMIDKGEFGEHFIDTAKYLLGDTETYGSSIDQIIKKVKNLKSVYNEANGKDDYGQTGFGFLDKLYNLNKSGDLEGLGISIKKLKDGTYEYDGINESTFGNLAKLMGTTEAGVASMVQNLGMLGSFTEGDIGNITSQLKEMGQASDDGKTTILSLSDTIAKIKDAGGNDHDVWSIIQELKGTKGVKLIDFSETDKDSLQKTVDALEKADQLNIKTNKKGKKTADLSETVSTLKDLGLDDDQITEFVNNMNSELGIGFEKAGETIKKSKLGEKLQESLNSGSSKLDYSLLDGMNSSDYDKYISDYNTSLESIKRQIDEINAKPIQNDADVAKLQELGAEYDTINDKKTNLENLNTSKYVELSQTIENAQKKLAEGNLDSSQIDAYKQDIQEAQTELSKLKVPDDVGLANFAQGLDDKIADTQTRLNDLQMKPMKVEADYQEIDSLTAELDNLKEQRKLEILVDVDTSQVASKVDPLVNQEKKIDVTADMSQAEQAINNFANTSIADKVVKVTGDITDADTKIETVKATTIPDKTAKVNGDNSDAMSKFSAVNGYKFSTKTVSISVNTSGAMSALNSIQNKINSINSSKVKSPSQADGNAHASGNAMASGNAAANGKWDIGGTGGRTLLSELGSEMVVINATLYGDI